MKDEIIEHIKEGHEQGLSLKEISFCETFLRTASFKEACTQALVGMKEGEEMLHNTALVSYITNRASMYQKSQPLTRQDLKDLLQSMVQDPLANPEIRLRALTKLSDMNQFELVNKEALTEQQDSEELDSLENASAEEIDSLLEEMRARKNRGKQ